MAAPGSSAADCLAQATRTARNGADAMAALQQSYVGTMMSGNIGNAVAHTVGIAAGVSLAPMMLPGLGWYLLQRFFRNKAEKRDDLAHRIRDAITEATELISIDTGRRFKRLSWSLGKAMDQAVDVAIAEAEDQRKAISQAGGDRRKQLERTDKLALSLDPLQRSWQALHGELLALTGPQLTP
jgi:hypothetical protein